LIGGTPTIPACPSRRRETTQLPNDQQPTLTGHLLQPRRHSPRTPARQPWPRQETSHRINGSVNPGSDILVWTDGRALVATGSPFDPVHHHGREHVIGQANNAFIFPGIGLGVILAEAREVTDELFLAAAEVLAAAVTPARLAQGGLYPSQAELREVSRRIAIQVVSTARDCGFGRTYYDHDIEAAVEAAMWFPDYVPYSPV
jgi:Malic enzyme, NAD binding domain